MPTYFITGTRRGIGLEMVRQLSTNKDNTVIAHVRDLSSDFAELKKLADNADGAKIHIVEAHINDPESIAKIPAQLPEGTKIDYLVQNAAAYDQNDRQGSALKTSPQQMSEAFQHNVIGPMVIVQTLLDRLAPMARIALMSTGSASIHTISSGAFPADAPTYNVAKTALNMWATFAAKHLEGKAVVLLLAPGWVKTDMGGPNALLDTDFATSSLLKVLHDAKPEDSGKFFNFDGTAIPW